MTRFRVVLDTCVMLPQSLNNLMLSIAEAGLFDPVWSPDLLQELERNLVGPDFGLTESQANHRIAQMRVAFPFAEVQGYQHLVDGLRTDAKDRHVLAAAIRSDASQIVTANLPDFPPAALDPFEIEAIHPDEFLLNQLDLDADAVFDSIDTMLAVNRSAPKPGRSCSTG
ncbi:MAG: PIN domain-containing protein [Rhodococcus sp. (in: high G+C Gram-positive bacteria)]